MRRSFPAWLAIFGIALQALSPLIANARPQDAKLLVPLCSVDGVTHYVEIPGGKLPVERRSPTYHEHCKLCVFGVERLAAVAPPVPLALRVARAVLAPAAGSDAVFPATHFHSPAAARAPPLS